MLRSRSTLGRPTPRSCLALAGLAALALAGLTGATAPAQAQSATCQQLGPQMMERKSLVEAVQKLAGKDKKMEPKAACAAFGKLAANGTTMLKWAETNKDWCHVPDHFVEGIKNDHEKVLKIRGQACGAAAKQAELEKKARSGQGGSGLLGGDGLEGTFKIPQGAL
jgi:hypothetical protein